MAKIKTKISMDDIRDAIGSAIERNAHKMGLATNNIKAMTTRFEIAYGLTMEDVNAKGAYNAFISAKNVVTGANGKTYLNKKRVMKYFSEGGQFDKTVAKIGTTNIEKTLKALFGKETAAQWTTRFSNELGEDVGLVKDVDLTQTILRSIAQNNSEFYDELTEEEKEIIRQRNNASEGTTERTKLDNLVTQMFDSWTQQGIMDILEDF